MKQFVINHGRSGVAGKDKRGTGCGELLNGRMLGFEEIELFFEFVVFTMELSVIAFE